MTPIYEVVGEYADLLARFSSNFEHVAAFSAVIMALGYYVYITRQLHHAIDPNPLTWLMFGYSTVTLTVLEWDELDFSTGEDRMLLAAPLVCSLAGLFVACRTFQTARERERAETGTNRGWFPVNLWHAAGSVSRWSFRLDVGLTLVYMLTWLVTILGIIPEEYRQIATWFYLLLANLTVFFEFAPMMRETYRKPETERAAPWFVWTISYVVLGWATWLEFQFEDKRADTLTFAILMLYPVLNAVMHCAQGLLAVRKPKNRFPKPGSEPVK